MDVLGRTFAQLTVTKRHGKASERRTCELSGRFSAARSKSFPSDELGNVRDRKKGGRRTEEGARGGRGRKRHDEEQCECTLFPLATTLSHQSSEFRVGHVISGTWDSFDVHVRSAEAPIGCS